MKYKLEEVIKKAPKRVCGENTYPVLSITKDSGLVLQSDRFKKQIASVDQSKYLVVKRGQGFSIQRGMNFNVANREYGIILMSVRPNAPYADRFEDDGTTIIYEGHDVQANYVPAGKEPKDVDQPMELPSGLLTENGKFFEAAKAYQSGKSVKIIKVYEKNKAGMSTVTF